MKHNEAMEPFGTFETAERWAYALDAQASEAAAE